MRRITAVLKETEASCVRKAVTSAGADHVVISHMSLREGTLGLGVWLHDDMDSDADRPVRLDVVVPDEKSSRVISAILRTARVGKIENVVPMTCDVHRPPRKRGCRG